MGAFYGAPKNDLKTTDFASARFCRYVGGSVVRASAHRLTICFSGQRHYFAWHTGLFSDNVCLCRIHIFNNHQRRNRHNSVCNNAPRYSRNGDISHLFGLFFYMHRYLLSLRQKKLYDSQQKDNQSAVLCLPASASVRSHPSFKQGYVINTPKIIHPPVGKPLGGFCI